jgi:hypothetical protein
MYSINGTTWSTLTVPAQTWYSTTWSPQLGIFAVVAQSGTGNRVMTTQPIYKGINATSAANLDLVRRGMGLPSASEAVSAVSTWTTRSITSNSWFGVCWSSELAIFVAVSEYSVGGVAQVMTSSDGFTWTLRTAAAALRWRCVCWSPQIRLFVSVALNGTGNGVMTSPDGITWTTRATPADNSWNGVCWSPERSIFVAVGQGNLGVMTSNDGIVWTLQTSGTLSPNWYNVAWGKGAGIFAATTWNGITMSSPDGVTWTTRTSVGFVTGNIAWAEELSLFVCAGSGGIVTSPDGINWTTRSRINGGTTLAWAPELRLFCISSNVSSTLTSPDGITWTTRSNVGGFTMAWSPELGVFASIIASTVYRSTPVNKGPQWVTLGARYLRSDAVVALDSRQLTNTLTNNSGVYQWGEFVQQTSTARPTYISSGGYAGNPYLAFNRANSQFLERGSITLNIATNGGFTALALARFTGTVGSYERIFDFNNGIATDNIYLARFDVNQNFQLGMRNGPTNYFLRTTTSPIVQGEWAVFGCRYNGVSRIAEIFKNGVSIASTTFSAAITNRVSTINSIAKPYTADSAHFNGDLAALYTYDRALSDTELGALTQNLLSGGVPLTEMVEFSVNGRKKFVVPATAPVSSRTVAGVVGRSYTGGLYPTFSNMDLSSLYLFDRALTRSEMDSVASLLDTGSEADSSLTRTSRYTPSATRIVQVPPATSQTITGSGLTQTFTISNASYANGTFTVSSSSRQQLAREVYKMFVSSAAEWWNTGSFYNETTGFQTSNLDPTGTGYRGEWAKIELPYRFTIKRYSIKAYSSAPERCPREFALFGSTDNLTWTKIDEKINQINWGVSETRTYTITNNQSYKFYLIVINRNNNNAQALINKMFLFGVIDPAPTASSVSARYLKLRTPGQKTPITQPQIEVMDATNTNIVPTKQVAVSSLINSYTSATIGSVMPSRSYVPIQSGLIAHFDPNDPLCYSGTGATMSNLVIGTSNATFSGTYSSNNGTVRLVNFNNALISNFTISSLTNIRTVSMWFYKHTSYTNEQLLDVNVSNSQISSAGGNWIGTNWSTGTLYYNGGISQGITWTNVSQRGTGGWHNVTVISNVAITGNLTIFGQSNTWWGMDVTFGPVLVYNRVITQTENEANFNAVLTNYFTRSLTGPIATPTNLMKSTLMYPPVSLSSDTTAISSTSTSYGAGSYSILASSTSGSSAFNAFDGTSGTVWTSGTDGSFSYNTTTGSYAGTVSSTDLYGNSYTGEYLQFKLPDPVYPSSLAITPDPTNFALNAPTNFTLLGSSNDLTYTPILTTTTSWASSATKTFLINGTTGSSVPYNNYRFVSTAIGTNNTFGNVSIAELQVYGSPTASPISVQQFPPTSLTANTTMITSGSYGLGTYISSASSVASTLGSFYAFDNNINTYWHSEVTTGALYSTSGGSYIGTTTMTSGSAGYAGEWLQLQVPNPVTLDSMSLVLRQDANLWAIRSLDTFYLFGSNNGFTWDLIKSFVSINNWTPSAKFFTTNATRSYTYFRILTTVIGQAGVNGNRNCIQIAEWKLYGRESPLQEFPPAAMTAATTTFGERTFGNGSFVANASSTFGANASTNAFDKSLTTFWRTSTLSSAKVLGNAGGTSSSGIVGSAGGGGATQAGLGNSAENGGNGGEGYSTDISGTTVVYGSGGGGGRRTALATNGVGGTNGGTGGNPGTNGIDGTGSGGGGADGVSASINAFSGNGGNGIVVIRYDTTDPSSIIGSGGTTTTSGNYRIHQFNVTGGSTFTVSQVGKCDLLIVGGGGAGGRSSTFNFAGGGGGGGKVIHLNDFSLSTGSYAITVGSGGIGGDSLTPSNGGNSSFDTIIAIGGGAGGVGGGTAAQSGGSGGGGGRNATGASATAPSATLIPGTTLTNTGTTAGWTSLGNVYGPTSGSYLGSTSMTAGGVGYAGEWLQLQVPSGLVLNNYSVTPNSTLFATRSPSTFYVFGSNDGTTWTIIDTEISLTWTSSLRVFPVNLMVSYTYFRLLATVVGNSDQVSGRDTVNITEWRLYGQEVQTDPYTIIDLGTDVPIKQIRYFNDVSSTTASTNVLGGELTLFNAAGTQVYSKALDSQQEVYNLLDTTYTDAYSMTKTPFSASFQSHNESAIGFDSKYTGTYTNESDSVPFGIRKTRDTLALQVGSQSTSGTLVTWSNAITIYNSGGISFGSGTVLARVFEGTALAGTGNANVNSFTVTLPQPLTSSSYVTYVTPEVSSGTDVFFCTVTNKTVSSFVVNVVRSDAQSWSSTLSINWELFM